MNELEPLLKVPPTIASKLRCPRCRGLLHVASACDLHCAACSAVYPVVNGAPILIHAERSVFTPTNIIATYEQEQRAGRKSLLRCLTWAVASRTPHVALYGRQESIARQFADLLAARSAAPSILVVGSGTGGLGVSALQAIPRAIVCEFDVYLTDSRMLVADLLDLPFEAGTFDAVVCQGVLEHVSDPHRAVEEVHRVLKSDGLVFSTTPFVLGVHLPVADYTRFSRLALIRLFRRFAPIDCDVIEGPAVALAYSLAYFLMALCSTRGSITGAKLAKYAGNYLIFWLRYIDGVLRRSPVSTDAAASYYYVGQKSDMMGDVLNFL